jgi:hypothetical protein
MFNLTNDTGSLLWGNEGLDDKKYGLMKNVAFWNIRTQFVLHRRHITSPLESPAS